MKQNCSTIYQYSVAYEEKQYHLNSLHESMKTCTRCEFHRSRSQIVFADGNASCKIMLIGEAPGYYEDRDGIPFIGKAGKLLDKILTAVKLDRKDIYICNTNKCLSGDTKVYLEDGSSANISHLVKHKYSGQVACIIEDQLIYKPVVNWYRSPRENRRLFKLGYIYSTNKGGKQQGAVLTDDHRVLVEDQRTWMTIQEIYESDEPIYICTGTQAPNKKQEALILGSILGDAHVTKNGSLIENHSIKQEEYVQFKADSLETLNIIVSEKTVEVEGYGMYDTISYRILNLPYFRELRKIFYPGGRKVFPYEYMKKKATDLTLAVWFMDDGNYYVRKDRTPSITLRICGYSKHNQEQIVTFFEERGFDVTLWNNGSLYFNKSTAQKFIDTIRPYIIESMEYKTGFAECGKLIDIDTTTNIFYSEAIVKEVETRPQDKTVYCLDVQDAHNFMTPGGIVHNCWPGQGNPTPNERQIKECFPYLKSQIDILTPLLIVAAGNPACYSLGLLSHPSGITRIRGREYLYQGIPVIAVMHPAALLRGMVLDIASKKRKAWKDWKLIARRFKELDDASKTSEPC